MNLSSLALVIFLLAPLTAYGQSVARHSQLPKSESLVAEFNIDTEDDDSVLATRAIVALKRLDKEVLVFRSLGDFEADGRFAHVPFEIFANDLQAVTNEVEPMLSRMPQSRLKTEITNALYSYRDGAFWWQKIHQSRVVSVSALTSFENTRASSDSAFLASVPYTVAIHWRQANRYLTRAGEMINETRK